MQIYEMGILIKKQNLNVMATDYSNETGGGYNWLQRNWRNVVMFVVYGLVCFFLGGWIL